MQFIFELLNNTHFWPVSKQQQSQQQGCAGPLIEEVQRTRKKAVFVERRADQDGIPLDFSIPKYDILFIVFRMIIKTVVHCLMIHKWWRYLLFLGRLAMKALTSDLEGLSSLLEGRYFQETQTAWNQGARENMIVAADRKPSSYFKLMSNGICFYYCQLIFKYYCRQISPEEKKEGRGSRNWGYLYEASG